MFKRKESLNFYGLLTEQAQSIRDTVKALVLYCADPSEQNGDHVKELEKASDTVRYRLVDDINRTFITPIDRDDLFRLSSAIDDLADYAWTTVKEARIYDIIPDKNLLEMSRMLLEMADGLLLCVQNLEKDHNFVTREAVKVKKMENDLNVKFHQSIADLFEQDDIKKILKYREIYNHMNHASDKGDLCADMLLDIVVKL
jgi:uncharacterized protein Yka (UPF0111/DUF47 family)